MFEHARRMGLKGIVSKRIGSRYVSGRTRAWLKTKNPHFRRI
jgi:ATP-dependent DNA ligase